MIIPGVDQLSAVVDWGMKMIGPISGRGEARMVVIRNLKRVVTTRGFLDLKLKTLKRNATFPLALNPSFRIQST